MAESILISKTDIESVYQLSVNGLDTDLNRFILNAQRTNIAYWLGEDLYYNLCENKADGDKYQALLSGESYEYTSGRFRYFYGVKLLIVWETIRLMLIDNKYRTTGTGKVKLSKNNGTEPTMEEYERMISGARSQVFDYHKKLKDYMSVKGVNFTEYDGIKDMETLKIF